MKKESRILGGSIASIIILSSMGVTMAVMGTSNSTDKSCIDIDCLEEKIKRMCMEGTAPPYLDCENILRCIDDGEQEIMKCAKGYPVSGSYHNGSFDNLILSSW